MSLGIIGNVYVGQMHTGNFEFTAIGDEVGDVERRLAIAFQTHMHQAYSYEAKRNGGKAWTNSPSSYRRVWQRWLDENGLDYGIDSFEDWMEAIKDYFGFRIMRFVRPTDVMRDGSKI